MRGTRRIFLVWACLLISIGGPLAAVARGEDGGQLPATVSFLEAGPLELSVEEVIKSGLAVEVHNDLGQAQTVHAQIVGLAGIDDAGVKQLFAKPVVTVPATEEGEPAPVMAAGATATARFEASEPATAVEPGSYELTVVASGASGGLARMPLTLTVKAASAGTDGAKEEPVTGLDPAAPIEVTLVAVNYLPSLLSGIDNQRFAFNFLAGILLALAIVGFGAALLWRPVRSQRLGPTALALCALAGATLAIVAFASNWDQPGPCCIEATPIPVASQVESGPAGTVASTDGSIARLEVSDEHELLPHDLDGAATYSGNYDIDPEEKKGEAKATVNVRDFWLYAALIIFLGVGVAYWLRTWFKRRRPAARARLRLASVIAAFHDELEAFSPTPPPPADSPPPLAGLLTDRCEEIEALLGEDEAAAAEKKVEELKLYLDRFLSLAAALEGLESASARITAAQRESGIEAEPDEVPALQAAVELLAKPFEPDGPDADSKKIDARLEEVKTTTGAAAAVAAQLETVCRHLGFIKRAAGWVDDGDKDKLREFREQFRGLGLRVLHSADAEALKPVAAEVEAAHTKLVELTGPGPYEGREAEGATELEVMRAHLLDSSSTFKVVAFDSGAHASIGWRVPGVAGATKLHQDDRVLIEVAIENPSAIASSSVEVDFGDGAVVTRPLPAGPGPVSFSLGHRYQATEASATVVVRSPDGETIERAELQIDPEPRAAQMRSDLAQADLAIAGVALILAVASGLSALYFDSATWGNPGDYLAAFVWGAVTGEGVKLAASIIDRTWGG